MKTYPIYLDDSYQKEMDATILEVIPEGNEKYRLLLDKTVFYPMGGGQATDQGVLSSSTWNGQVYQVIMKDGEIWHYVSSESTPASGLTLHGVINWDRRYSNMKKHSAGHIVDFSMYLLGYSPTPLIPIKGDHDKKLHIVYQGTLDKDIKGALQEKTDELVSKNLQFSWAFKSYEEIKEDAIYLQPYLPTNKPLRALKLDTVGSVADGGTQLHTTSEVGKVIITEIRTEDNTTIVSYDLA